MTMTTTTPTDLFVGGVNVTELAHGLSWEMEFELVPGERPFGPEYVPVKVLEIHSGDKVWGFLAAHGLPGKNTYVAVSELLGDDNWHTVVASVDGDDEDAMDAAGRAVVADLLIRSELARQNA